MDIDLSIEAVSSRINVDDLVPLALLVHVIICVVSYQLVCYIYLKQRIS